MEIDDHGITGSTVVQQRVTELLNVRHAILAADPLFYTEDAAGDAGLGAALVEA